MPNYGSPEAIEELAARLRSQIEIMRTTGAKVHSDVLKTNWLGAAGTSYKDRAEQDWLWAQSLAGQVDGIASLLDLHANQLRTTLAMISRAEQAIRNWFNQAQHVITSAIQQAQDAASDAIHHLTNLRPPWEGWRWQPHNLPESGSKDWLDVADFMKNQGKI